MRDESLPDLIIGDNSFIGVSHLSQERAMARTEKLDVSAIAEVIETAYNSGASGYTFSTHPVNVQILKAFRERVLGSEFQLYPILPYAQAYVRLANEKGARGLIEDTFSKLSVGAKAKLMIDCGFSVLKQEFFGIFKTYIDMELGAYLQVKPKSAVLKAVLLHEVVTDLCLGLGDLRLFETFVKYIREKYQVTPGFVTYNLPTLVKFLKESGLGLSVAIMTPFNSIGYQMSPSRESCEQCLSDLREAKIIAMSVFAGGFLPLNDAMKYLSSLPPLAAIAVGASSKEHARETFSHLSSMNYGANIERRPADG